MQMSGLLFNQRIEYGDSFVVVAFLVIRVNDPCPIFKVAQVNLHMKFLHNDLSFAEKNVSANGYGD
jgi:hypothetical protein